MSEQRIFNSEKSEWEIIPDPFELRKKIEKEMLDQDYHFSHLVSLTKIKFQPGALFEYIEDKTVSRDSIISDTIKKYKAEQNIDIEVKLVDEPGLEQQQKAVIVFVKLKNKN